MEINCKSFEGQKVSTEQKCDRIYWIFFQEAVRQNYLKSAWPTVGEREKQFGVFRFLKSWLNIDSVSFQTRVSAKGNTKYYI